MKILRNGIEIYDLAIDNQTTITRRLMVENSLTLRVDTATALDLQIMDYVQVDGERYELLDIPDVDIAANGMYSYDAVLVGNLHRLDNWLVEQAGDESYYYDGTASDHISMILSAIAEKETGWSVDIQGTLIAGTKHIDYTSMSCLSALHKLCEEFSLEFDVIGQMIVVAKKIERPSNFDFSVGRAKGLYKISRGKASGQKITTRMFGLGSKTNSADGLRLTFDQKFVERNIDIYGLREDKVVFDDIFPRRNSTITSDAVQLEAGKVLWSVTDSTMDFDLTANLVDEAKIVFNSGDCAGVEFVISSYNDATKTITFKEFTDNNQTPPYTLPRAELYPRTGDEYVYVGITMPDSYLAAAKTELKEATEAEIARSAVPQHPYTVDIDPRYIKQFVCAPMCGDLVRISHDAIGLDAVIRIIGVTFPVINPSELSITINDKILVSSASSMMRTVRKEISAVNGAGRFHPMMGNSTTPLVASNIRAKGFVSTNDVSSHEFLPSMVGYGNGMIVDPDTGEAHVWTDHIHARKSFETLEMRFRKMLVSGEELVVNNGAAVSNVLSVGEEYLVTASGTAAEPLEIEPIVTQEGELIEWPLPKGANRLSFTVKGEAGIDYQMFILGDILRYTWRDKSTGLQGASGYLVVRAVIDEFTYTADVVEGSPEWLAEGMSLALFGSETNPDRQGFIVLSARERTISIFDGVNSTKITPDNLKVLLGRLDGIVTTEFGALKGSGLFCQSFYGYGDLVLKKTGKTVSHELSTQANDIHDLDVRTQTAEINISTAISSIDNVTGEVRQAKAEILVQAMSITNLETGHTELRSEINLKADVVRIEKLLNVDGTIRTDSLVADGATITRLHAVSAEVEGTIIATSGRVKRLELGDDGTSYLSSQTMMFWGKNTKACIGRNTAPTELAFEMPAMFESTNDDFGAMSGSDPNIAMYLKASGTGYTTHTSNGGNNAIFIEKGDIAGFALYTKKLYYPESNNITLNQEVSVYVCYNNTAVMTINLPPVSTTQIGKVFYVKQMYHPVKVVGKIFRSSPITEVGLDDHITAMFINDGEYWIFNYLIS